MYIKQDNKKLYSSSILKTKKIFLIYFYFARTLLFRHSVRLPHVRIRLHTERKRFFIEKRETLPLQCNYAHLC